MIMGNTAAQKSFGCQYTGGAREIVNMYETTPFYKTNGFKIGVGSIVVTGCVVLAVVAFPGVAIVTGAAVGSALGVAFGGTIGGITAERNGGSFLDGFADGMLVGAIGGAISGAVGEATATAGLVVSVVANGVTDSAIYAGETAYRGVEITSRGLTVSFLTRAVLSGVTRIGVGKYTNGIERGSSSGKVWDYSKQFEGELANFNAGYEIKNVIEEDLYLVQFHSNAEVGSGRSLKYWTTFDTANGISTVDVYMNQMALLSNWGARDNVSIAKIPVGTKIKYAVGTAKEQVGAIESRPGGGLQILFEKFYDGWVLDTRPLL